MEFKAFYVLMKSLQKNNEQFVDLLLLSEMLHSLLIVSIHLLFKKEHNLMVHNITNITIF